MDTTFQSFDHLAELNVLNSPLSSRSTKVSGFTEIFITSKHDESFGKRLMSDEPEKKKEKDSIASQIADAVASQIVDGVIFDVTPELVGAALDSARTAIDAGTSAANEAFKKTEDVASVVGEKIGDLAESTGEAIGDAAEAAADIASNIDVSL